VTRPHPPGAAIHSAAPGQVEAPTPRAVEVSVADRIAAAVLACPMATGLHSGRFAEVATYLAGRRVPGVCLTPTAVFVHLIGIYPATVAEIDGAVRAAVAPDLAGLPLMITIEDYNTQPRQPPSCRPARPWNCSRRSPPMPSSPARPAPVVTADPTKEIL
jgi:hypothetical protein